jgi:hypothetical protein
VCVCVCVCVCTQNDTIEGRTDEAVNTYRTMRGAAEKWQLESCKERHCYVMGADWLALEENWKRHDNEGREQLECGTFLKIDIKPRPLSSATEQKGVTVMWRTVRDILKKQEHPVIVNACDWLRHWGVGVLFRLELRTVLLNCMARLQHKKHSTRNCLGRQKWRSYRAWLNRG